MKYGRWVHWIMRWYPQGWRERYEQEMLALLEQHTITPLTLLNLWVGALDAQLNGGYDSPELSISFRIVRSTAILFIAALFFAVLPQAWSFPKSAETFPFGNGFPQLNTLEASES
ncbi:hypothetical protein EPA93_26270 [Ktedonosporobacter rubrisoli]|uniref:Uncharacterized protein n=1 Tax=Ktedonosporobacter rubrisoli TaxID=2509675 RepID=A0A4P6JVD3_KTERU|nr:hypothetical protein [Ktedonosporobacter rubrisoli]QBD79302.1 hypothetical protein EPA93_26270 [Ktedonosporobacter rubrisoli]